MLVMLNNLAEHYQKLNYYLTSWKFGVRLPDVFIFTIDNNMKIAVLFPKKSTLLWVLLALISLTVVADQHEDSDGDGLSDIDEARIYRTDPQLSDTDLDGLADGLEVEKYWTLPLIADTDGDGFLDGVEVRLGSDPTEMDSQPDPANLKSDDLDGDGISNAEELELGSNPQHADSDFDGLDDGVEIRDYFTDPMLVDSDGDGMWDGEEVRAGRDPGDAEDAVHTP
jgi:hypothetical protein